MTRPPGGSGGVGGRIEKEEVTKKTSRKDGPFSKKTRTSQSSPKEEATSGAKGFHRRFRPEESLQRRLERQVPMEEEGLSAYTWNIKGGGYLN